MEQIAEKGVVCIDAVYMYLHLWFLSQYPTTLLCVSLKIKKETYFADMRKTGNEPGIFFCFFQGARTEEVSLPLCFFIFMESILLLPNIIGMYSV